MGPSLLVTTLVSSFFFTAQDPQVMLSKQYKSYITAQAMTPGSVNKYRDRIMETKKPFLKSTRLFLDTNIDWELYAKSIFSPKYWDSLTKKQKKNFIKLLQKVHIRKYAKHFSANTKFSVHFDKPTEYKLLRGEEFARVRTTVKSRSHDVEFDVDFVFHMGTERWALCDIYIDGLSKSKIYRREVRNIFKKKGYAGVMKAFRNALSKS